CVCDVRPLTDTRSQIGSNGGAANRYNRTSGPTPASPINNITSSQSVTAGYGVQWAVTFDATGLTGDATGTVVTVGASDTIAASALPATRWVNDGDSISYAYGQTVTSSVAGKDRKSVV